MKCMMNMIIIVIYFMFIIPENQFVLYRVPHFENDLSRRGNY